MASLNKFIFYLIKTIIIYFLLATSFFVYSIQDTDMANLFVKNEIVPDIIDQVPPHVLKVKWEESNIEAHMGNVGKPNQMKNSPIVEWDIGHSKSLYTLIMVDPDAPSRQRHTNREWNHWLILNIPDDAISEGVVKRFAFFLINVFFLDLNMLINFKCLYGSKPTCWYRLTSIRFFSF